jgi:hypothetical protein
MHERVSAIKTTFHSVQDVLTVFAAAAAAAVSGPAAHDV